MTQSAAPSFSTTGTLVTMLVPQVGRVLALQTAQRTLTSEYVIADHGGQNVYQHLTGKDESSIAPTAFKIEPVGELSQWLERPHAAQAVAALVAAQAEYGSDVGPLTFARAVQHMSDTGCEAHVALDRALAIGQACAQSYDRTAQAVQDLVYGRSAGAASH